MPPITINSALYLGQKTLRPIINNYKNEVLWIMQDVLNKDTQYISLNKSAILESDKYDLFVNLIKRREKKEPLQQILNSVSFYGYKYHLKKNVFIPRPETELIIDIIKNNINVKGNILEIGTGTGCIPIVIELEKIGDVIHSIDINKEATDLAILNSKKYNSKSIEFINTDFFQLNPQCKYDLIISNPPYIPLIEIPKLDYEVTLYDPLNALTDYDNGLTFYQYFYDFGIKYLNNRGYMLFEFGGKEQVDSLRKIFKNKKFNCKFFDDLNNDPRFILIQKK